MTSWNIYPIFLPSLVTYIIMGTRSSSLAVILVASRVVDCFPNISRPLPLATRRTTTSTKIVMATTKTDDSWTPGNIQQSEEAREKLLVWPLDQYNAKLLNEVHPRGYKHDVNPHPVYDLIAIGAGAGGLVSSRQSARRGAKSAMISEHLAGGDCLNTGCVPSKAIIRSARAVQEVKRATEFGIVGVHADEIKVDFAQVMERVRRLRAKIAPADSHAGTETAGAHVFQGRGRLTGPNTVEVNGQTLEFKICVLATGGRPGVPNIPGLKDAPYTTNEQLFNLEALPPRMVILGAGVVALEMAQTFSILGSKVTVINRSPRLFASKHGDAEAAELIEQSLNSEGVIFRHDSKVDKVETLRQGGQLPEDFPLMKITIGAESLECECLLVATGRLANVEDLGLEAGGVEYKPGEGVVVNDLCQSVSNPSVYAVGDCVAGVPRLTHMSGEMAKMVVQNGLAGDNWKLSSLVVPQVMYTEPEYATVGIASIEQAQRAGLEVDVYKTGLEHNDRAILESSNIGFCKVVAKKGSGEILGATIVAERAGEMINEVSLAIKYNIGLFELGRNIHSYPTTGECVQFCGIQYVNKNLPRLD